MSAKSVAVASNLLSLAAGGGTGSGGLSPVAEPMAATVMATGTSPAAGSGLVSGTGATTVLTAAVSVTAPPGVPPSEVGTTRSLHAGGYPSINTPTAGGGSSNSSGNSTGSDSSRESLLPHHTSRGTSEHTTARTARSARIPEADALRPEQTLSARMAAIIGGDPKLSPQMQHTTIGTAAGGVVGGAVSASGALAPAPAAAVPGGGTVTVVIPTGSPTSDIKLLTARTGPLPPLSRHPSQRYRLDGAVPIPSAVPAPPHAVAAASSAAAASAVAAVAAVGSSMGVGVSAVVPPPDSCAAASLAPPTGAVAGGGVAFTDLKEVSAAALDTSVVAAAAAAGGTTQGSGRSTGSASSVALVPGGGPGVGSAAGLRLLLVEDVLVNQKIAHRILSAEGYDVTIAGNGLEAIGIIDTLRKGPSAGAAAAAAAAAGNGVGGAVGGEPFVVILMDLNMPVMSGLDAAKLIRERGMRVPIVALTGNAMESERELCRRVGMNGFITKPFRRPELLEGVAAAIKGATLTPQH
jgi:CheY-like chemotaxis protein